MTEGSNVCMCVSLPGGGEVLAVTECVIGDTKYSPTQSRWREGEEGGEEEGEEEEEGERGERERERENVR